MVTTDDIFKSGRNMRVERDVDVLVVGGGPAGVGAAFAAARPGENACCGTVQLSRRRCNCRRTRSYIKYDESGTSRRIVGGVADEIARRVVADGFGTRAPNGIYFEVEG